MLYMSSNPYEILKILHSFSVCCRPLIYLYVSIQYLKDKIDFCKHCFGIVERISMDLPVDSKKGLGRRQH